MGNVLEKLKDLLLTERAIDMDTQNRLRISTNHSIYFGDMSTTIFNMQDFIASLNNEEEFKSYTLKHKSNNEFIDLIFTHGNYARVDQKVRLLMLLVRYFSSDKDINSNHIYGFLRLDKDLVNEFIGNLELLSKEELNNYDILLSANFLNNFKFENNVSLEILDRIYKQLEKLFYSSLENSNIKTSIDILDYTNRLRINKNSGQKYGEVDKKLLAAFATKLIDGNDENLIKFIKLLPIPKNSIINFRENSFVDEWVLRPFAADIYILISDDLYYRLRTKTLMAIHEYHDFWPNSYLSSIFNIMDAMRGREKLNDMINLDIDLLKDEDFLTFLMDNYKESYSQNLANANDHLNTNS